MVHSSHLKTTILPWTFQIFTKINRIKNSRDGWKWRSIRVYWRICRSNQIFQAFRSTSLQLTSNPISRKEPNTANLRRQPRILNRWLLIRTFGQTPDHRWQQEWIWWSSKWIAWDLLEKRNYFPSSRIWSWNLSKLGYAISLSLTLRKRRQSNS